MTFEPVEPWFSDPYLKEVKLGAGAGLKPAATDSWAISTHGGRKMTLINAVTDHWTTANGIVVDVSGLPRCIEKSAEQIKWKESRKSRPRGRGIGFS